MNSRLQPFAEMLQQIDTLIAAGETAEALRSLARIYEQQQELPEVNRRIADALFIERRLDEAAGMYAWLVEADPREADDRVRLAYIDALQGELDNARIRLESARKLDPNALAGLRDNPRYGDEPEWLAVLDAVEAS